MRDEPKFVVEEILKLKPDASTAGTEGGRGLPGLLRKSQFALRAERDIVYVLKLMRDASLPKKTPNVS